VLAIFEEGGDTQVYNWEPLRWHLYRALCYRAGRPDLIEGISLQSTWEDNKPLLIKEKVLPSYMKFATD